jgi:hypothetical protein
MNRLEKAIEIVRQEWTCPSSRKYDATHCLEVLRRLFPDADPNEILGIIREAEAEVISLAE